MPKLAGSSASGSSKPSKRKPAKGKILSSKVVYDGPLFRVTADDVLEPSGVRARRDIVRHNGSIVVIAVEEIAGQEPRVLLEHQYRHAAADYMWELPAGRIDAGEAELSAAKRELKEETGYSAARWKKALMFYASPGFLQETMAVFLARGLRAGVATPEADEVIRVKFVPLSECVKMAINGKFHDGKTIAGVLWLAQVLKTNG